MDKIKERDTLTLVEQCSELKLIGYINEEEVIINLDKMAKIMIMGYLSKKKLSVVNY